MELILSLCPFTYAYYLLSEEGVVSFCALVAHTDSSQDALVLAQNELLLSHKFKHAKYVLFTAYRKVDS